MTLTEIVASIVARLAPPPPPPERAMSSPEDIRWAQMERDALVRRARALDVEVDLERSGHEYT
jgi:hypothetical protein